MRYQSVIDPSYKNNSHTLTIDFIADKSGGESLEILDVGCSAGYLGEYLRHQGHHVTGLDVTPEAIAKAVEFLNEAYCMKVEEFFAQNPDRCFDVVIFGDVLEHVTNAEEVLRQTLKRLKPRGKVIASIPNVAHVAIRAMLLAGRWDYSDLGLLDRDHVRFFTSESIDQLFQDSGFEICDKATTNLPVETVAEMCSLTLEPRCVEAAQALSNGDPSGSVFQYVVVAQPASEQPRIVCLVPETTGSLFHFRIKLPLTNWANQFDGLVRYRTLTDHRPEDLIWGDLFVFQRLGGEYTLHLIKALKQYGKKVVFEIDDLLTDLPEFLSHHRGSKAYERKLIECLEQADLITTTTPRLAAALRDINPNVHCVPNTIERLPALRQREGSDDLAPVTLIVASSDRVLVHFLIEPLKILQEKYGERIKLLVVGPIDSALRNGGLHFEHKPILTYEEFRALLDACVNPIGLIPLDDSRFSSCKSPIKYLDYSAAQIVSVCSNVPPYSDYVRNGETGLLVENTTSAWVGAIEILLTSPEKRVVLSNDARKFVEETHLARHASQAWQSIVSNLDFNRTPADGLIEAAKPPFKIPSDPIWIAKKLLRLHTYKRVWKILGDEGFAGLKNRLIRR